MSRTVVLIACSASKVVSEKSVPVRELYTGRLFRAAVEYAEAIGAEWAIVSALYGMLLPTDKREPYDFRASERGNRHEREAWARTVRARIEHAFGKSAAGTRYIAILGADYRECAPVGSELPLAGKGIGAQYSWLRSQADAARGGGLGQPWTVIGAYWSIEPGSSSARRFVDHVTALDWQGALAHVQAARGGDEVTDIAGVVPGHVEVMR